MTLRVNGTVGDSFTFGTIAPMTDEEIDNLIDEWHHSDSKLPLHEYLGMTWVEQRRVFPKIVWHDELPGWIISSDIAAYHPLTKTIHIRNDQGIVTLIHELIHRILDIVGFGRDTQIVYDEIWIKLFGKK